MEILMRRWRGRGNRGEGMQEKLSENRERDERRGERDVQKNKGMVSETQKEMRDFLL